MAGNCLMASDKIFLAHIKTRGTRLFSTGVGGRQNGWTELLFISSKRPRKVGALQMIISVFLNAYMIYEI